MSSHLLTRWEIEQRIKQIIVEVADRYSVQTTKDATLEVLKKMVRELENEVTQRQADRQMTATENAENQNPI